MNINFDEWCTKRAAEIMEEEYGPNWMETCPDDDAYNAALERAGYEFPFSYEQDKGGKK
ncbi:MAG: hypothetical protein IKN42_00920 [Elusimicrobia bacterium]|nr:hypothetical protein [Elusimicrobiota bacterium]